ncbi:heterogeneous nuclear ribonucleoprotein 1-like isoform X1 [Punica granatum]|uniref:Heterogeneous nuclear ribonucleoprotein 1-like isoform X1 n=1 Tax=Punica granatum TaxID=22663 RepID=A0A6P8DP31_PUNGR|nr:heterogeneous nuclear ribonucleoprotein 1-like isoform X1 [Punica granatum]
METGKLFIGGISWDTNEDRLREYFESFGEVIEAVIMKDRATGRARGFGFVVFADPSVAERVVLEKHVIDGRTVEAKKAVPRDDQSTPSRNGISSSSSNHGSPGPGPIRTRKIFVGGLASNVTEGEFKRYFDRFGTITDVVVMYDHNTQRPRGFGFITYDSEEAVDRVLQKSFHELNGKMVEVKRAIPKELSPGPTRGQLGGGSTGYNNNNLGRFSIGFLNLNGFGQGYGPSSVVGCGVRAIGRAGVPQPGPTLGLGPSVDQVSNPVHGINGNFSSSLGYGQGIMNPSNNWTLNRYNGSYMGNSGRMGSMLSPTNQSLWGTEGLNPTSIRETGTGSSPGFGCFGNGSSIWSSSNQGGGAISVPNIDNIRFSSADNSFAPGAGIFRRNKSTGFSPERNSYDGPYKDLYENSSVFGDSTWKSSPPSDLVGSSPFSFGLSTAASDVRNVNSAGYVGGYGVVNKQSSRGIAA